MPEPAADKSLPAARRGSDQEAPTGITEARAFAGEMGAVATGEVPPELRALLRPDEQVLWFDEPPPFYEDAVQRSIRPMARTGQLLGIGWCALMALTFFRHPDLLTLLVAFPGVAVALPSWHWLRRTRPQAPRYAITNRRVLVLESPTTGAVREWSPQEIGPVTRVEDRGRLSDIWFGELSGVDRAYLFAPFSGLQNGARVARLLEDLRDGRELPCPAPEPASDPALLPATSPGYAVQVVIDQALQPGERLLWSGQPDPSRRAWQEGIVHYGCLVSGWTGLALWCAGVWLSTGARWGPVHMPHPEALIPLAFTPAAAYLLVASLRNRRRARKTIYLLTDRRVLLTGWGESLEKSFGAGAVADVRVQVQDGGRGDLVFHSTVPHAHQDPPDESCKHVIVFHDVPDVHTVQQLAIQALGPPIRFGADASTELRRTNRPTRR